MMNKKQKMCKAVKPFRTVKKNRFARAREQMAQYGFPLHLVMCGKIENGRFYLTNRTK